MMNMNEIEIIRNQCLFLDSVNDLKQDYWYIENKTINLPTDGFSMELVHLAHCQHHLSNHQNLSVKKNWRHLPAIHHHFDHTKTTRRIK